MLKSKRPAARIESRETVAGKEAGSPSVAIPLRIALIGLALVLFGSAFAVDPFAEAAFDAPKRLCVMLGSLIASAALLWAGPRLRWREWSTAGRCSALLGAACILWLVLATIASAHNEIAWQALRRLLLFALLVPIGASRLLQGRGAARLGAIFAAACGVNALISLAQAAGWRPLDVAQLGGRYPTGALLGNEGYVALACALLGAACAAAFVSKTSLRLRWGAALAGVLCVATIAINRQSTSALALLAACVLLVAVRWHQRWLATGLVAIVAIGAATALIPALRSATWTAWGTVAQYQQLTTFRLGAWTAALDMMHSRPMSGYGPGSFAAEELPHRLAAEMESRERFVQPTGASFIYAHNDYLQLAAEAGIPALLAALGALAIVFVRLFLRAQIRDDPEPAILFAILGTGAITALAWFPMQVPFTASVLLLALGRAWRVSEQT